MLPFRLVFTPTKNFLLLKIQKSHSRLDKNLGEKCTKTNWLLLLHLLVQSRQNMVLAPCVPLDIPLAQSSSESTVSIHTAAQGMRADGFCSQQTFLPFIANETQNPKVLVERSSGGLLSNLLFRVGLSITLDKGSPGFVLPRLGSPQGW